jgi:Zn-dependent peptidase ImmA (M78 family)/transcriptional regulator with XRE-family HTH domain
MDAIPDRVRGLIGASGLSRGAFAQEIGLDDSKLSKSLSGVRRFSSLDLAAIAEFCHVTVDWLLTGEESALAVAARTTTGDARTASQAADWLATLRGDLAFLGYEQPWRPVAAGSASRSSASRSSASRSSGSGSYAEQGHRLADAALARVDEAGRSVAEADLPRLIEDVFGADVAIVSLDEGFDGLAAASDEARLIVAGTCGVPGRQRFTLAHELCHLLAGDNQAVYLDKDIYGRAQPRDPSEIRANGFAAAFLMPAPPLRAAVGTVPLTDESFAALACDLRVTPSALAIRLRELRLIDSQTCEWFRGISGQRAAALAGRNEDFARRVAAASMPRPPGLLLRDSYAAYESGDATLRPYANLLGVDADELRAQLESSGDGPRDA